MIPAGESYIRYDNREPDMAVMCNDLYGYRWKLPLLTAIQYAGKLNRSHGFHRSGRSQGEIALALGMCQQNVSKAITKFRNILRGRVEA